MLVYDGSNGKRIDKEIFDRYGRLDIHECYTVVTPPVGAVQTAYTVFRLIRKQRDTAILKFAKYCSREHEINVGKEWMVYDINRFKSELDQHPGFIATAQNHIAGREGSQTSFVYSWTRTQQRRNSGLLASVCK